jgi:hypothetical protein
LEIHFVALTIRSEIKPKFNGVLAPQASTFTTANDPRDKVIDDQQFQEQLSAIAALLERNQKLLAENAELLSQLIDLVKCWNEGEISSESPSQTSKQSDDDLEFFMGL